MKPAPVFLLFLALPLVVLFLTADALGETCVSDSVCDPGQHCETCFANGAVRPRCTRTAPLPAASKNNSLPFNRYTWLTTHNSFALINGTSDTGSVRITFFNQQDTVAEQLKNGVRGLMLDFYDFQNDIWLCHSFGGQCYNYTAFQPAITVLRDIAAFLDANPTEVITIFLEDYVTTPQAVSNLFDTAGLRKYWFPVTRMPKNGGDWPLLSDMLSKNQRLIVFTSKSAKEASEGIAYEWRYVVENQYGDGGMVDGECPNRAESLPMNNTARSLVLVNYFRTVPNLAAVCKDNSQNLLDVVKTCQNASAGRWPNYIAVDFYKRSDGGGSPLAVDVSNGNLVCGCDNLAYCKVNGKYGDCDIPPELAKPPTTPPPPKSTATARTPVVASIALVQSIGVMLSLMLL